MSKKRKKYVSLQKTIFKYSLFMVVLILSALLLFNIYLTITNTKKNASKLSKEINNQVTLNFDHYFSSMIDNYNYLSVDLANANNLDDFIQNCKPYIFLKKELQSVSIISRDGEILGTTGIKSNMRTEYLNEILNNPFVYNFKISEEESIVQIGKTTKMNINDSYNEVILLLEQSSYEMDEISNISSLGENGSIIILDNTNQQIYNNNSNINEELITKYANDIILGSQIVSFNGVVYSFNIHTITNTRFNVVTIININDFYKTGYVFTLYTIALLLVGMALAVVFSYFISKKIATPLKELEHAMQHLENSKFAGEIDLKPTNQLEASNLRNSFINMTQKIKELMDSIVQEQKLKRTSELKALQNQINPHFLYNTLDSIVYLAESNQNKEVVEMTLALARFFRISISRGENIINVTSELEHVKYYMVIQHIRYKNKFNYNISYSEDVKDLKCMKLILQPFVENSIYHGIKNLEEMGEINVNCYKDLEYLYFTIKDNGLGMREEKILEVNNNMKDSNSKTSVGTKNVYQRIKLYYGSKADVIIESSLDEYTLVTIKIPLERENKSL